MPAANYVTLSSSSWADDEELPEPVSTGPRGWGTVSSAPVVSIAEQRIYFLAQHFVSHVLVQAAPEKRSEPAYKAPGRSGPSSNAWGNADTGSVAIQRSGEQFFFPTRLH